MKKILSIIGARPQFVKMALLSWELRKHFKEIVLHTGQHYDLNMSDVFFRDLKLPKVNYNLEVGSTTQARQTAQIMELIEFVIKKEKPDLAIIYGDTNSTIAGALAATKLHIPVAHVEAGMRSYNRRMPEEINRVVSDHISDLLFCSTKSAAEILKKEGIKKGVHFVGDVMYDLQFKTQKSLADKKINNDILRKLELTPKEYILATVHRQENTDEKDNLQNIFRAFEEINQTIVYPIHPRTRKFIRLQRMETYVKKIKNLKIINPTSYSETISLEQNAKVILTDSGGVQKEAYMAQVPCVTLREETEWVETVQSGWNKLAGTDVKKIARFVKNFPKPKSHPNFLGKGEAYLKISQIIKDYLGS